MSNNDDDDDDNVATGFKSFANATRRSNYGSQSTGPKKINNRKLYVDPRLHLGLEHNKNKSDMLALALSAPDKYFKLRADVIKAITENAVLAIYDNFYNILSDGIVQDGDGNKTQLKYTDKQGNVHSFIPALPEDQVSDFAMSASQNILKISENCVESILPRNHLDLSKSTMKGICVASGMNV